MRIVDIHGATNLEIVRGGTNEWYWATDYIHGDLYEAEELFLQGHPVRSNRLYLIHYPDGMVYEPVHPVDGQYLGNPVYDGNSVVLLVVNTHFAISTPARDDEGNSSTSFVYGEKLLQSTSPYLAVITDATAK